jgi:hypothetical protein
MSTHTALAQKSAGEPPRPKMLEDIQERMRALIAQHGSVSAALTVLRHHLELNGMTSKLTLWKILFHILMFQQNSIKARQNLHMNIVIAYRKNGMLSNVNNLLFAMTHYNCLETKMR